MDEQWTFEGGQWIISDRGERIAQIYNWHAGYLERGERIASLPQVESQNAVLLEALTAFVDAKNMLGWSEGECDLWLGPIWHKATDAIREVKGI
jgi:hypothetical protein